MTRIDCQACTPEGREEEGCSSCGGYGMVLGRGQCEGCGRYFWVRPGVISTYVGKRWKSFDGLEFWVRPGGKVLCARCPEFEEAEE